MSTVESYRCQSHHNAPVESFARHSKSQSYPVIRITQLMWLFLKLLGLAFWRAFEHDAFAVAKASAYSYILTFFPPLLVLG